jgi:hypothetical protein
MPRPIGEQALLREREERGQHDSLRKIAEAPKSTKTLGAEMSPTLPASRRRLVPAWQATASTPAPSPDHLVGVGVRLAGYAN